MDAIYDECQAAWRECLTDSVDIASAKTFHEAIEPLPPHIPMVEDNVPNKLVENEEEVLQPPPPLLLADVVPTKPLVFGDVPVKANNNVPKRVSKRSRDTFPFSVV